MATVARPVADRLAPVWEEPPGLVAFLSTVNHKRIGVRYLVTASTFFLLGGVMALMMRAQLIESRNDLLAPDSFNQLFTMHGFTMIFLFATPMLSGFANYLVPLMIGARDMAYPRLNAFSYWVYLGAGVFVFSSFLAGSPPNVGWFNYVPLASERFTPGDNVDFYNLGLLFLTISTTAGAINLIVTIFKLRAPGMSLNRLPLFCWAALAQAFAIVFALPALSSANILLELQRKFGWHFFDVEAGGDPILWQHLFWIFGHPDVYIIVLPALGIVSAIVPTFSRRPMVAYTWVAVSIVATGLIGFGVWVHHMFALGLPQVTMALFAAVSMAITIPSGIQFFAWLATMLRGRPVLATPMLWIVGFLVTFVVGGVTGVMFAAVPFDQQVTDSYFVVAHFHYVLIGGAVFPIVAGLYFWLPKISGRMFDERLGRLSFWLFFVGFNVTFFPMHVSGLFGMPRRIYTYEDGLGWDTWNLVSTAGSWVLGLGVAAIVAAVLHALFRGREAGPDPWGGESLEWSTGSPPPDYNFGTLPIVRGRHPQWEAEDRAADEARARRGELILAEGHETLESSELEAHPERVLHMPKPSLWPFLVMLALATMFGGLLLEVYLVAIFGAAAALGGLAGWHRPNPELADQ